MPELPDIEAYLEALRPRVVGQPLLDIRISNPFVLRTPDPPLEVLNGGTVEGLSRLGKRLVFEISSASANVSYFLVIHLMIAGRLHWRDSPALGRSLAEGRSPALRGTLASFDFPTGTLILTEAGTKRRASLHVLRGREALAALDPGGIEVLTSTPEQFAGVLRRENRTLKRALTDPQTLSGVGNAYSDEILHRACLSPLKLTLSLTDDEMTRLHEATLAVLTEWTTHLVAEARNRFPEKVTAFRPEMAVHGKYGARCPACGAPVQRIVYVDNRCDYCPGCQTGGKVLADRALPAAQEDWPRDLVGGRDGLSQDHAISRINFAPALLVECRQA
jgi:formamidopyrimidine-DNA glycosylase